jgi:hypothetical protein
MACARPFACDNAGNKIADRMAMMAITTSSSIRVKAFPLAPLASAEVRKTGKMLMAQIHRIYLANI